MQQGESIKDGLATFVLKADPMHLLNVNEVAKRLAHSQQTVRNLISSGALECYRCPGIRVSEEQLDAYFVRSKKKQSAPRGTEKPAAPQAIVHLNADRLREAWREQGVE